MTKVSGFLSAEELSTRWGGRIKARTLNNWRTTGGGPPFTKIGGAVLYPIDEVEKWERERTVRSTCQYTK